MPDNLTAPTCEAIQKHINLEAWQLAEIQQAIQEADANDFASEQEINTVVMKYAGSQGTTKS